MISLSISRKGISFITKSILSLLALYMVYTGCTKVHKEDIPVTLTVSTNSLSFPFPGEQQTFTVSSNDSWTVRNDASWLTVSPSSGSNDGTVNVTAIANPSDSQREATITVSSRVSGIPEQTVTVTQAGVMNEPEMVFVQGGTFTMGCTEQGDDCLENEKPPHQVTLGSFYISKYEVTQAQWKAVMNNNPSYFKGDNRPVEWVRWDDAQEFITRLNSITGKSYRLPTEAEWEYAARGGNNSEGYKYSGSNTVDDVAWHLENIPGQTSGEAGYGTQPVGAKLPNELGIYDMSGNVYEWCSDWLGSYNDGAQTNPQGPSSGSSRVRRGGSWHCDVELLHVSYRTGNSPEYRNYNVGIRLILSF